MTTTTPAAVPLLFHMTWGRRTKKTRKPLQEHEDRRRSSRKLGRPRTPEPSLAEFDDEDHHRSQPRSNIPEDIIHRLETLQPTSSLCLNSPERFRPNRPPLRIRSSFLNVPAGSVGFNKPPLTRDTFFLFNSELIFRNNFSYAVNHGGRGREYEQISTDWKFQNVT